MVEQTPIPQQAPAAPLEPQSHNKLPLIIGVLLLLAVGIASYLFGQRSQVTKPAETAPTVTNTTVTTTLPAGQTSIPSLPQDWTYAKSTKCNVNIPIPPKKEPYYTQQGTGGVTSDKGLVWQFEEYEAGMYGVFSTTARVIYKLPPGEGGGSGYVAGDVEIICSPNTDSYTNQTLLTRLEQEMSKGYTADTPEDLKLKINSKREISKWNRDVLELQVSGGVGGDRTEYILATNKHVYLVRTFAGSSRQVTKDATQQILDALTFMD